MMIELLPRLFSAKLHFFNYKNAKAFTTTSSLFSTQTKSTTRLPHGFNGPTPYSLFIKEKTEGMIKGDKVTEAFKRWAIDWKNLSMEQKTVYFENAKKMKEEKRAEFESLPNDTKQDLMIKNVERNEKRKQLSKKRELHEFRKSTNKPKQPASSFALFVKDIIDKMDQKPKGKEDISQVGKNAGEMWKNMSEEQKKPYEERGMQNKEEYQRKLAEWKENNSTAIAEWKEKHKPKSLPKVKSVKPDGEEKQKMESTKSKRGKQGEKQAKTKSGKNMDKKEKKESKKGKSGKKEE